MEISFWPELKKRLSEEIVVGFDDMGSYDESKEKYVIHLYVNGEEQKVPYPNFVVVNPELSFMDAVLYDNYVIIYTRHLGKEYSRSIMVEIIYDFVNQEFIETDSISGPSISIDYERINALAPFKVGISVMDLIAIINRWDQKAPQEFTLEQLEDIEDSISFITDGDENISREEINEHIFSEFPVLRNYQNFDKPVSCYKMASILDNINKNISIEEGYNSYDLDGWNPSFVVSQIDKKKKDVKVRKLEKDLHNNEI